MDKTMRNVQRDMTFRNLPNGAREITHPSGVKVVETRQQRQAQRAEMVADRNDLDRRLADFDAEEVKIMAVAKEKL